MVLAQFPKVAHVINTVSAKRATGGRRRSVLTSDGRGKMVRTLALKNMLHDPARFFVTAVGIGLSPGAMAGKRIRATA